MPQYNSENPYIITKFPGEYFIDETQRFTVPKMIYGSKPTDGGNLIIEADEYENFIAKEPLAKKYIRRYIGAEEFLYNKLRYCLWLKDCPPDELRKMKFVYERVKNVREFRLQSQKTATRKSAEKPTLFQEIRQPDSDYICVPAVSGESRRYIPMAWVNKNVIAGNAVQCIPNATLWLFGQLESIVHMAWMHAVSGRLGISYRYSAQITYNNFVFINADKKRLARIEKAAQKILDARAKFPNASLADLYDEVSMPYELREAHAENDAAVMDAYGYPPNFTELQIVTDLFYRYEAMITQIPESMIAATSRRNFSENI
ncbi:MAG: hypothetical protein IJT73_11315 [Selenomonadaceae bacterium]|nr:hypothetical protein [Selenomonadaceae bacterium]